MENTHTHTWMKNKLINKLKASEYVIDVFRILYANMYKKRINSWNSH